jgi:hypothetical protein
VPDYVREMVDDDWMDEMVPLIPSGDEKMVCIVIGIGHTQYIHPFVQST